MDKYDVSYNDPYCYIGTPVLKNKLNIKNFDDLEKAEREISAYAMQDIKYQNPPYNLKYLQDLHKQLFYELYEWAGELRSVNIFKEDTTFCYYDNLETYSNDLFKGLEKEQWLEGLNKHNFCIKLAEHYCEFNMLHPFREGNGRVQRLFFEHLALYNRYELDWSDINKDDWIQANIDGITDYGSMKEVFEQIIK